MIDGAATFVRKLNDPDEDHQLDRSDAESSGHIDSLFDENELLSLNDRKEEYYNKLDPNDRDMVLKMNHDERLNHVLIDNFKGKKMKIKIFDILNDDMRHK